MGFSVNRRSSLRSPACAGKRRPPTPLGAFAPDHPRVCGEKIVRSMSIVTSRGSPPRVRGKEVGRVGRAFTLGITPACAGKRRGSGRTRRTSRDHPRVCGEKLCFNVVYGNTQGSPPRVRGKVCIYIRLCGCVGITPACAGKRTTMMGRTRRFGDHPRVCGEKKITPSGAGECTGSPPRVRGKAFEQKQRARNNRITPACAGKSSQPRGFLGWP